MLLGTGLSVCMVYFVGYTLFELHRYLLFSTGLSVCMVYYVGYTLFELHRYLLFISNRIPQSKLKFLSLKDKNDLNVKFKGSQKQARQGVP